MAVSAQDTYACPTASENVYSTGGAFQFDEDNPVRPAWNNADKNLELRSYALGDSEKNLVVYSGEVDPIQPPQLATLFSPGRLPLFSAVYQAYDWNWEPSPNPGTRGDLMWSYPVTVLGMATTPGETLVSPVHGRDLGSPWGSGGTMVIFADEDSVTLHFTRDDSASPGYTVHIDNICTDPNLLATYNALDNADSNSIGPGSDNIIGDDIVDYDLPGLTSGQMFGTARGSEIRVAIVDAGSFMDPRSVHDWWQIRPAPSFLEAPALYNPAPDISLDNPVMLEWGAVSGAVDYQVVIDDDPGFGSPAANATLFATKFSAPALTEGKTFYWRVRARNGALYSAWSSTWALNMNPPPPPAVPALASPADLAQAYKPVTMKWDPVVGAASYQIQVDNNADFSSIAISTDVPTNSYVTSYLTDGTQYYWRVRTKNILGVSEWSAARSFIAVTAPPPIAPGLISPANGSSSGKLVTFTWNPVNGASGYMLQISKTSDFSKIIITAWTKHPTYTKHLASGNTYYWRVRTRNIIGSVGSWSAVWSVKIQ